MAMIAFCVSLYIIVVFVHFGLSFVHICFIDVVVPRLPIRILCDLGVGKEKLHFNLLNKEMTENIFEKKKFVYDLCFGESYTIFTNFNPLYLNY